MLWCLTAGTSLSTGCGRSSLLGEFQLPEGGITPDSDGSSDDLARTEDLAAPPDLALPPDVSPPFDLSGPPDLSVIPDLAMVDLPPRDLAIPDLALPPDLTLPRDFTVPPDFAALPDFKGLPDLVSCGALGQNCCDGTTCLPSRHCQHGVCAACGGIGEPCCNGVTCTANGTSCFTQKCLACGGPGQPCCPGGTCANRGCCDGFLCVAENNNCMTGVCKAGECSGCGAIDHPCCAGQKCNVGCCSVNNLCTRVNNPPITVGMCSSTAICTALNTCTPCGLAGLMCCPNNNCSEGVCDGGSCKLCGGAGQPCCSNNSCLNGGCCGPGVTCVAASNSCGNGTVCYNSACIACGAPGQPCCGEGTCLNGGCCSARRVCAADGASCGTECAMGPCGTCRSGRCVDANGKPCGGVGDACCSTPSPLPSFCTAPASVCGVNNGAVCTGCGAPGQPCCDNNDCPGGGCCDNLVCVAQGGRCAIGTCEFGSCGSGTCGGAGQPCCKGAPDYCTATGAVCFEGSCQRCGGAGQLCCISNLTHAPLECAGRNVPGWIANGQIVGNCVCGSCGLKINEVVLGTTRSTSEDWVEVANDCQFALDLTGYRLVLRSAANNNGGPDTLLYTFSQTLSPNTFLLIAGAAYNGAGVDGRLAVDLPEAGGGIGVRDELGVLVDSVAYDTLAVPNGFTEGAPAATPNPPLVAPPGRSLARYPNLTDTNANRADFRSRLPSPRAYNPGP